MKIKEIIKVTGIFLGCVIGLLLSGCNKKSEDVLVMACSGDYPPFEFWTDGELVGFEIDLAKKICEKLGYELKVKNMKFNGLIGALNSGSVDFVMSGMTFTEERAKVVDFSNLVYAPKFAILHKKEAIIDDAKKMQGKTMGVQYGTTMETFLKEKANELGDIEIKGLARNPELIQELKVGRIDGIVIEESQAKEFAAVNNELGYSVLKDSAGEGYAIAFPKGSELKAKFNEVLAELIENGELKVMMMKWGL